MKTGGMCDWAYMMEHDCEKCKLAGKCQLVMEVKNEISNAKEDELPNNKGTSKAKTTKVSK